MQKKRNRKKMSENKSYLGLVDGGLGVVLMITMGVIMSSVDPEPVDVQSSSSSLGQFIPSPDTS